MPWTGQSFQKHNKKLTPEQSMKAAAVATAALKSGVPEGESIAIANAQAKKNKTATKEKMYKGKK